jgi:hypothetical protein
MSRDRLSLAKELPLVSNGVRQVRMPSGCAQARQMHPFNGRAQARNQTEEHDGLRVGRDAEGTRQAPFERHVRFHGLQKNLGAAKRPQSRQRGARLGREGAERRQEEEARPQNRGQRRSAGKLDSVVPEGPQAVG